MAPDESTELLTKEQLSKRLNLSVRSIERLVASGELKALKIGRATRFDPRDVEAYLDGLRAE